MDTNEIGGAALAVGFLLAVAVLYREPVSGWNAATAGVASAVYFLALPAAGLLAGVYAYIDGPYSAAPLFLLGSYLGVFGIALTLGTALRATPIGVYLGVGAVLLALSLVALVASVLRATAAVPLDSLRAASN